VQEDRAIHTARKKPPHSRRTLGFLLRDNSRLMRRRFVHYAREARLPLNLSEAALLSQVWREPGISQAGVANLLDMETISVVRLVDTLEHAKLLQRRPHARDRRVWTLWLTPAGENAIVEVQRINDKVRGEALAGVPDDDRERPWTH
jgi:MarR family transcriptional regulator, transcriptional regulator for hemolysin